MRPIIVYPSFGPMIFLYTVWSLFFLSYLAQNTESNLHSWLFGFWIFFLVILIIKDLLDWLIWEKYLPIMCIRDNEIDLLLNGKPNVYKKIMIKQIARLDLNDQISRLSIFFRDGNLISVDLSRIKKNKQKDIIKWIKQRMLIQ